MYIVLELILEKSFRYTASLPFLLEGLNMLGDMGRITYLMEREKWASSKYAFIAMPIPIPFREVRGSKT